MAAMNEKDYYAILEVDKDATTDEIRKAFQQKARKLHPDVNKEPDAEERFKEVSEAYAVLSDEGKRRRYDAMRSGSPFGGATGGYASPAGTAGGGYYSGDPFEWGFPFGGSYTSRRTTARSRAYNPKAGTDIVFEVTLDDDIAAKGAHRGITYQRYATCDACHGHGSVAHTQPVTCPTCGGTGHMAVDLSTLFGFGVIEMTCPECEGAGRVVEDPCSSCGGSGRVLTASEVVIDIPANVHDGDTVRVEGMGNAGTNGKPAGDFVCKVELPSERLTARQSWGCWLIGLATPLFVLGLLSGTTIGSMLVLIGIGLFMVIRDGVKGNAGWWSNARRAFASGAANGLPLMLIMLTMSMCTRVF
ncbi:MAG: DnaJ domain-containing protein [Atopobiaceae bacterium]|nr:DnaJ domain-containing protein [Atopobiaceae bacterium]